MLRRHLSVRFVETDLATRRCWIITRERTRKNLSASFATAHFLIKNGWKNMCEGMKATIANVHHGRLIVYFTVFILKREILPAASANESSPVHSNLSYTWTRIWAQSSTASFRWNLIRDCYNGLNIFFFSFKGCSSSVTRKSALVFHMNRNHRLNPQEKEEFTKKLQAYEARLKSKNNWSGLHS